MSWFGGPYSQHHIAEYFSSSPSANISLPLISEEALFALAVVPGAVTISLALLTPDETVYTPLFVGIPSRTIVLSAINYEEAVYDITVSGPRTIVLPLISDEAVFVLASVSFGIVWPGEPFPQVLQEKNYQEIPPMLALRFPNAVGPANIIKGATKGVRKIAGSLILTQDGISTEVSTLDAFFMTSCRGGSAVFQWQLSRLPNTPGRFRFVKPPAYSDLGGGNFEAQLELEMLP